MAPIPESSHWRIIAEQVTVEMDSLKLSALINQLCAALDEEANKKRPRPLTVVRTTAMATTSAIDEELSA